MKLEDQAALREVREGNVGNVTFIRYNFHAPEKPFEIITQHIKEALYWISNIHINQDLKDINTSANQEKNVWLITCQFTDRTVANLFFDFSPSRSIYIKQMEIAGTTGLYVFDSSVEQALQSDFLQVLEINPEYMKDDRVEKWWGKAIQSFQTGQVALVEKGGSS